MWPRVTRVEQTFLRPGVGRFGRLFHRSVCFCYGLRGAAASLPVTHGEEHAADDADRDAGVTVVVFVKRDFSDNADNEDAVYRHDGDPGAEGEFEVHRSGPGWYHVRQPFQTSGYAGYGLFRVLVVRTFRPAVINTRQLSAIFQKIG